MFLAARQPLDPQRIGRILQMGELRSIECIPNIDPAVRCSMPHFAHSLPLLAGGLVLWGCLVSRTHAAMLPADTSGLAAVKAALPPPVAPRHSSNAALPNAYRQALSDALWGTGPTAPSSHYREQLTLADVRSRVARYDDAAPLTEAELTRHAAEVLAANTTFELSLAPGRTRNSCGYTHIGHRHLDGKRCNARPRRQPRYPVSGNGRIRQVRHRHYDGAACANPRIAHLHLDGIGCTLRPQLEPRYPASGNGRIKPVRHARLDSYSVPCNPNDAAVRLPLEKFGAELTAAFTEQRVSCELNGIFTPIAIGDMVETKDYGRAVVVDYVIADRVESYIEWASTEVGARGRVKLRSNFAIHKLIVLGKQSKRTTITGRNLTFTTVDLEVSYVGTELSPEETKEILIRRLLERGETEQLLLQYPEERKNLSLWEAKYPPRKLRARDPAEWARPRAGRLLWDDAPALPKSPPRRRRTRVPR